MEMHQVRYFLAVCEHLSFMQAARKCHITQPSLTRAIQLLEKEFGGHLFLRERLRIHLTEFWREVSLTTVKGRSYSRAVGALVHEATRSAGLGHPPLAVKNLSDRDRTSNEEADERPYPSRRSLRRDRHQLHLFMQDYA